MTMGDRMNRDRIIRVQAPAKVNLVLRVLDRRPDGYHNLWSLMQTVDVSDTLEARETPGRPCIHLTCDDASLPTDRRNLVYRAAEAVLERAGRPKGVGLAIAITKRIPVSAGLGGGSSNAAATILALNELLQLGWSAPDMIKVGAPLGSDVPFFFCAPSAVVTGRGEAVEPVTLNGTRWVVLVNPGFPIETKWAYEQLSARRSGVAPLTDSLRRIGGGATLSWDRMIPLMENDFETAVGPAHPELERVASALRGAGAEAAMLSGSGATVFGIFRDEAAAVRAKRVVSATPGWRVFAGAAGTGPLTCTSAA